MLKINKQHPLYYRWNGMMRRCYDIKFVSFHNYGGRGIKVDLSWHIFDNFINDMFQTFDRKLTLERIDNNADYSKGNCKWASRKEQSRNTRRTKKVLLGNVEMCAKDASKELGLKHTYISRRLRKGWSEERALKTASLEQPKEFFEYEGQLYGIRELSRIFGINRSTIYSRIKNSGWTVKKAVETPLLKGNKINEK